MKQSPESGQNLRQQQTRIRFFWFLAGAVVNYLMIGTPFKWLKAHTSIPSWGIAACSIGVSATFFFMWNYFINFRTNVRKRDALKRYTTAVILMWAASSTLLGFLTNHDPSPIFGALELPLVGHLPLNRDIIATQFFLAGAKFLLYHKWVFPLPPEGH